MARSLVAIGRLLTTLESRVIGSFAPLQQLAFPDLTRDPFQAVHLDFASTILKHHGWCDGGGGNLVKSTIGKASGAGAGAGEIMECGRGDRKTKRGKRFRGTFGKCRPDAKHKRRRLREKWELPPGAPLPTGKDIA